MQYKTLTAAEHKEQVIYLAVNRIQFHGGFVNAGSLRAMEYRDMLKYIEKIIRKLKGW